MDRPFELPHVIAHVGDGQCSAKAAADDFCRDHWSCSRLVDDLEYIAPLVAEFTPSGGRGNVYAVAWDSAVSRFAIGYRTHLRTTQVV